MLHKRKPPNNLVRLPVWIALKLRPPTLHLYFRKITTAGFYWFQDLRSISSIQTVRQNSGSSMTTNPIKCLYEITENGNGTLSPIENQGNYRKEFELVNFWESAYFWLISKSDSHRRSVWTYCSLTRRSTHNCL